MEALINVSVFDRVVDAINQTTDIGDCALSGTTRFAEDLNLRRIGRIKLGLRLEKMFDIELPDEVLEQAATVDGLVKYMSRHYYRDINIHCSANVAAEVTLGGTGVLARLEDWFRQKCGVD